jgi:hypothetical protein
MSSRPGCRTSTGATWVLTDASLRLSVYVGEGSIDPQVITLFKEVRNLLWLNFQVPHAITNMVKDAKRVYPHAVSLMEAVRTYG